MNLTLAETQTMLKALSEAQSELCIDLSGNQYPEATAHYKAMENLKIRLRETIPESEWPVEYF